MNTTALQVLKQELDRPYEDADDERLWEKSGKRMMDFFLRHDGFRMTDGHSACYVLAMDFIAECQKEDGLFDDVDLFQFTYFLYDLVERSLSLTHAEFIAIREKIAAIAAADTSDWVVYPLRFALTQSAYLVELDEVGED